MIQSRIIGAGPADLIGVLPDDELPDVTGSAFAEEWVEHDHSGECLFCQGKAVEGVGPVYHGQLQRLRRIGNRGP